KNVVPFKESDRIVRGTILKFLTKQNNLAIDDMYNQLLEQGIKREKQKFEQIIVQLEKDGLVKIVENKITLP
ncbi:MAG: hypothetical protein AABX82_06505, partial [Nanoarchaeota archaeon]